MSADQFERDTPSGPTASPSGACDGRGSGPVYASHELLRGGSVAWIDHGEERYTLRLTRQGKLILTK